LIGDPRRVYTRDRAVGIMVGGLRVAEATPPKSRVERYLERAQELRDMARNAKDTNVRAELLVLAQQYDKLADDVRKSERSR
jgi:hypothetical protein